MDIYAYTCQACDSRIHASEDIEQCPVCGGEVEEVVILIDLATAVRDRILPLLYEHQEQWGGCEEAIELAERIVSDGRKDGQA